MVQSEQNNYHQMQAIQELSHDDEDRRKPVKKTKKAKAKGAMHGHTHGPTHGSRQGDRHGDRPDASDEDEKETESPREANRSIQINSLVPSQHGRKRLPQCMISLAALKSGSKNNNNNNDMHKDLRGGQTHEAY